jgi:actin-related protein
MFSNTQTMIIDNGNHSIKFGLSTSEEPDQVIPSFIKYNKFATKIFDESVSNKPMDFTFGSKIFMSIDEKTRLEPLINAGEIVSMENILKVYNDVFKRNYSLNNSNTIFFICQSIQSNVANSNALLFENFFESMGAAVIGLAPQVVLELFSSGLTSGLVVDVGHGFTQIAPIVEGIILKKKRNLEAFSGCSVNNSLANYLGFDAKNRKNLFIFDQLKKKICDYETRSFDQILNLRNSKAHFQSLYSRDNELNYFHMPDGNLIYLEDIINTTNTLFFDDKDNLQNAIQNAIDVSVYKKIDKLLMHNFIITGGVTNSFQFSETLESKLNSLKFKYMEGSFVAHHLSQKPEFSAWIGAKIVSSLPAANTYVVTKSEYEEMGSRIFSQHRYQLD